MVESRCAHPDLQLIEGERIKCRVCGEVDVQTDPRMRELLLGIEHLRKQIEHVQAQLKKQG
jgi:hypothetical protein